MSSIDCQKNPEKNQGVQGIVTLSQGHKEENKIQQKDIRTQIDPQNQIQLWNNIQRIGNNDL